MAKDASNLRSLAAAIHELATQESVRTIATAESCTGGNVAAWLTAIPGSSDYFQGSIVSYSNEAKHSLLKVPNAILDNVGAVSEECAASMAAGSRLQFGVDIAVSTTGIAGPAGGTARKPIGLVYIGLATDTETIATEFRFSGDRSQITAAATEAALQHLYDALVTIRAL